ncbi:unnamed protein product, partial [Closterium sp. Naga37s-1]
MAGRRSAISLADADFLVARVLRRARRHSRQQGTLGAMLSPPNQPVRRLNVHEYQAAARRLDLNGAALMGKFGVNVPKGIVAVHARRGAAAAKQLASPAGQILVTKQTGAAGKPVNKVLIAEMLKVANEMYFAILLDRVSAGPVSPRTRAPLPVAPAHPFPPRARPSSHPPPLRCVLSHCGDRAVHPFSAPSPLAAPGLARSVERWLTGTAMMLV